MKAVVLAGVSLPGLWEGACLYCGQLPGWCNWPLIEEVDGEGLPLTAPHRTSPVSLHRDSHAPWRSLTHPFIFLTCRPLPELRIAIQTAPSALPDSGWGVGPPVPCGHGETGLGGPRTEFHQVRGVGRAAIDGGGVWECALWCGGRPGSDPSRAACCPGLLWGGVRECEPELALCLEGASTARLRSGRLVSAGCWLVDGGCGDQSETVPGRPLPGVHSKCRRGQWAGLGQCSLCWERRRRPNGEPAWSLTVSLGR